MTSTSPGRRAPVGLRFERSPTDRVVSGVAGGLAARWCFDSTIVRLALIVLSFAGGLGIALYLAAWAVSLGPLGGPPGEPVRRDAKPTTPPALVAQRSLALGLGAAALLLMARRIGVWPGDAVMVPAIGLGIAGAALWYGGPTASQAGDPLERLASGRISPVRVVVGVLLALGGVAVLSADGGIRAVPRAAAAIGLSVIGLAIVGGPVLWQLFERLREEQRERIRSEERSDMAAHLHDSVLQTLALMQRSTGDPRRMVMLARRQERELRSWLYDQQASSGHATIGGAFAAMAAEVEVDHEIAVELVVVGDAPMDDGGEALLGAAREAAVNAARHAKVESVAVYLEVAAEAVIAFVRDTGCGFVPGEVGDEHRGISDSIRARLARCGGTARVESGPGEGTEWELRVPRRAG